MQIKWLGNACIEIKGEKNILIDPNYLKEPEIDPDLILVTHEHSDHIDPAKLDKFSDYKLYAPQTVFDEYDLDGVKIEDGSKIDNDIKVIGCDCYGTEEAVCYFFNGIYHTADASSYPDPGEAVALLFTACFSNLYDEYLESIEKIRPGLTVPYHIDPNNDEDLEEAEGLKDKLLENDIKAVVMSLGEEIPI
jgi:L-ascorbate metabolism protein UlaG (beta-lactamase superfamily)